jgi:hypothetical protein
MAKLVDLPQNNAANLVNTGLASLVKTARTMAEAAARSSAHWLNTPVVSQIFKILLNKLEQWVAEGLQTQATFLVINFQTKVERDNYIVSLNNLLKAQETGVGHEQALAEMRKRVEELIRFNGVVAH